MANDLDITTGTGATVTTATADIGGVHHQVHFAGHRNGTDTFTVAGAGAAIDASRHGVKSFALQVKGTGAVPTAWNVVLEGSMDNVNWTEILSHISGEQADGATAWTGTNLNPCLYFRARCVSVTLGTATNIVARILGM